MRSDPSVGGEDVEREVEAVIERLLSQVTSVQLLDHKTPLPIVIFSVNIIHLRYGCFALQFAVLRSIKEGFAVCTLTVGDVFVV